MRVHQVIATLKLALQDAVLQSAVCKVWDTFVNKLDVQSLRACLNQVIVILLPFVQQPDCAATVQHTLRYLIATRRSDLRAVFREIPMLPNIPALQVLAVILRHSVLFYSTLIAHVFERVAMCD